MEISFDFGGKKFVVTGASSGIGRCVAVELAKGRARVLAIARRAERLESLKAEHPNHIDIAAVDVADGEAMKQAVVKFAQGEVVHGSVHAAGSNRFTPLRVFKRQDASQIMDVTLFSGIELIRLLSTRPLAAETGSHILISSVSALTGQSGLVAYSAAKSAILGAVRSMALELAAKKIRVNAISPGWIPSEMTDAMQTFYPGGSEKITADHPLGIGSPEDAANLMLFLLSDAARWITGTNIVIDGGYCA